MTDDKYTEVVKNPYLICQVEGPRGWTQTISSDDVDTLCRMGILSFTGETKYIGGNVIAVYKVNQLYYTEVESSDG